MNKLVDGLDFLKELEMRLLERGLDEGHRYIDADSLQEILNVLLEAQGV